MDRYLDSQLGSYETSFDAMWPGVERALLEAQYDANAQSIRDDLKRGPQQLKKATALPGAKDKGKGVAKLPRLPRKAKARRTARLRKQTQQQAVVNRSTTHSR